MKGLAVVLFGLVLATSELFAQTSPQVVALIQKSLDKAGQSQGSPLRKLIDLIEQKKNLRVGNAMTLVLGNFTYADSGLGSPFSRFLEDQFSSAIVRSKAFNLFPRDVLANLPAGMEDLVTNKAEAGAINGSISGKFYPGSGGDVIVDFQLASFDQAKVLLAEQILIPKGVFPPSIALEPLASRQPTPPPVDVFPSKGRDLTLSLVSDRGVAGTYFAGEEMVLTLLADQDCWVKVYQIDGAGTVKLIYPNKYTGGGMIAGKTITRIPALGAGFAFRLEAPYGLETIRVVASTTPFSVSETAFRSLGTDSEKVLTRGMSVESREGDLAEAQIQYTVNPLPSP